MLRLLGDPDDKGWLKVQKRYQVDALKSLYQMARWKYALERMADVQRLYRMGIDDVRVLRAAIREYATYRPDNRHIADPIRKLLLELVGVPIQGYIPTSVLLAREVVEIADIQPGDKILEPNGGSGHIADEVAAEAKERGIAITLHVCELNSRLRDILEAKGHQLVGCDFLEYQPAIRYQRILMNPPFEDGKDMRHVRHAYGLLADNGILVAITSEGPFFRIDRESSEFREWLDAVGGDAEQLPDGTFKESDRATGVATRLIIIRK